MGAKLKSKTHLQNTFFDFLSRSLRVWLQSLKKVVIWPLNFFFFKSKKVSKNAPQKSYKQNEIDEHEQKWKKVHFSVTFLLITFFGTFFQKFFNVFEISVKFCFFWHLFLFFWKKIFVGHISTFFELWRQMRRKRLKKSENLFLWMYLRI